MSEITERYIINLDKDNSLLATQGVSYGRSFTHKGFYMDVTGCETMEQADEYILDEIASRGWLVREKWWQIWRPKVNLSGIELNPDDH